MDIAKKLREIEEHFSNISADELEKNLIKAGLGRIQPSSKSNMRMITDEELQ